MARFERNDGTSDTFREIALDGRAITVTDGRVGTEGHTRRTSHATIDAARREYERLVGETLREGYVAIEVTRRTDSSGSTPPAPTPAAKATRANARPSTAKAARPSASTGRSAKPKIPRSRSNAATLAGRWDRPVPAEVAALLGSDDLAALQQRTISVRYAGDHEARLRFEDGAFEDLSAWMEDVGLGDDIVWEKQAGDAFRHGMPIAIIDSIALERELLSVRTDQPGLPVSIFSGGRFYPLWGTLAELVGELRGTTANPRAELRRRLDEADALEAAGRHADAATLLEAAAAAHDAALRAHRDGSELLCSAYHRAGFHFAQAGLAALAERSYERAMELGGDDAASNLILMAVEQRKWGHALERVERFWDRFAVTRERHVKVHRYRALIHAMLDDGERALAAARDLEALCFAGDSLGGEVTRLEALLAEAGAPSSAAVAGLRAALHDALGRWHASREAVAHQSPRAWWDSLDAVWRAVLLANVTLKDELASAHASQFDEAEVSTTATKQQLAQILALRDVKIYRVTRRSADDGLIRSACPATLAPLAYLEHLETLDCAHAAEPYSLAPLARLTKLRELDLSSTAVTDLSPLAGHPALERLTLKSSHAEDLTPLASIPRLAYLDVWRSRVTDLTPLAGCTELRVLVAGNTEVQLLPPLTELQKLETADFRFARFEKKFARAFQEAHPECTVTYSRMRD